MNENPDPTTIYIPAPDGNGGGGGTRPAPYVLTEEEVIGMLRLEGKEPGRALKRYRHRGWLKPTQIGNRLRYLLPDVLRCLANIQEEIPR